MMMRSVSPFTVSQWQELEHQALIFKYLMAGLPIPLDLVLPIQKSFESISSRFFHHPTMGYCSFYGKKIDPEPGRCKRTDGKKWRCSKDAYPDSKYCERHMHRGRNRSRKPVESQTTKSQSVSAITPLTTTNTTGGSNNGGLGGNNFGSTAYQNIPLHAFGNSHDSVNAGGVNQVAHYNVDHIPFGIPTKDNRYLQGLKQDSIEHTFFSETTEASDNAWSMLPSLPLSRSSENTMMQNEYQQHSFFSTDFVSGDQQHVKQQDCHSLRPLFDEWPKARDSWSGLEVDRSNQTSYSTTQLTISIPMTTSDLSATSDLHNKVCIDRNSKGNEFD